MEKSDDNPPEVIRLTDDKRDQLYDIECVTVCVVDAVNKSSTTIPSVYVLIAVHFTVSHATLTNMCNITRNVYTHCQITLMNFV